MKRILTPLLLLALPLLAAYAQVVDPELHKLTADGPYIIHQADGRARVISVGIDGDIIDTVGVVPRSFTVTSHDGRYSFEVGLHDHARQDWHLSGKRRLVLIGDVLIDDDEIYAVFDSGKMKRI